MSRRLCLAALGVLAVLGLLAPAAMAASSVRISEVGTVGFPDLAFVITSPKAVGLDAGMVSVLENGQEVDDVTLVPAQGAESGTFGAVLVLDASDSMSGEPIDKALGAARAFAGQRAVNQSLAVVTFNRKVKVPLGLTVDKDEIETALASTPDLAQGTYLYDAVAAAISLLQERKVAVGSVVLLSDGADTGSRLRASQVAARARAAHVRVFTVGLRSDQFRASTLKQLASVTGGAYSEADSPKALASIYGALSRRLSNEYLLQYRSPASPNTLVRVQVAVSGVPGAVRALYRTPALPATHLPPFHRSFLDRFWVSSASVVVVSLAAALLLALSLGLVVVFVFRLVLHRGPTGLQRRMKAFVAAGQDERPPSRLQRLLAWTLVAIDRALSRYGWWARFKEEDEIADGDWPPAQIALVTAASTIGLMWLVALALPPFFVLVALVVPTLVARSIVKRKLAKRREKFADQLPDNLTVLASALRAGHSFPGAMGVLVGEADDPARSEFSRIQADERLGVPVEDALLTVARRMENGDLEQVALVAALQRQAGGNTAEVLDTVVASIRERYELRRMLNTLTAQGRASRWVLTAMPFGLAVFLTIINPDYMKPLYTTAAGQVILVVATLLVAAGFFVIGRIMNIKA